MQDKTQLVELTADIASAYLAANTIPAGDVPGLIRTIHDALAAVVSPAPAASLAPAPAVPIKKSITPDYLISLEDGRKYKSLKRHLRTKYGMSPDDYRRKWGLPRDYPMVAPNYAQARSQMARSMGLGQAGRGRRPSPTPADAPTPKRGPGRPRKNADGPAMPAKPEATAAKRGPGRPRKRKT